MKTLRLSLALAVFLFGASSALNATHPAEEKLVSAVTNLTDAIFDDAAADLSASERRARIRKLVDEELEFSFIVRRAFGRNWQRLAEDQQEEVVDLVIETLITTYVDNFAGADRPEISFGRLVEVGPNRVEIPSTVVANGRSVQLLYRLGRMEQGWEVYDVVAEGVSMVANYRQQIDQHFRRGTAEGLLERLRKMAQSGETDLL